MSAKKKKLYNYILKKIAAIQFARVIVDKLTNKHPVLIRRQFWEVYDPSKTKISFMQRMLSDLKFNARTRLCASK